MSNAKTYPKSIAIRPSQKPVCLSLRVPGSKSITNRALILAALAGDCQVTGALRSEDTEVMIDSLQKLGFEVESNWQTNVVHVRRPASSQGWIPSISADLFIGNSGTSVRFLTALCALGQGQYRLDGIERMRERPIQDLIDGLTQLGVEVTSERGSGCPPVIIKASGLKGGNVTLNAAKSSQFVSALLLVLPFADGHSTLQLGGDIVSEPYIDMTVQMLRHIEIRLESPQMGRFSIPGNQPVNCRQIDVEPDASSASYFFAAAAITGGEVTIEGLNDRSLQGDVKFVDALEKMGCRVKKQERSIIVIGGDLHGIDIDMNAISDTVMSLAAVACFAKGPTTIRNIAHIRHKETDRIEAVAAELTKAGQFVEVRPDGLTIHPMPIRAATFETYNDHRMAMSLALLGLRAEGIVINDPGCVVKTYPSFWDDFNRLSA